MRQVWQNKKWQNKKWQNRKQFCGASSFATRIMSYTVFGIASRVHAEAECAIEVGQSLLASSSSCSATGWLAVRVHCSPTSVNRSTGATTTARLPSSLLT